MSRELLSGYLSVRTGGWADVEIVDDVSRLRYTGEETVIGRGTKLLAADGGIDGRVLVMRNAAVSVRGSRIAAESGATLPVLAGLAAKAGLSGLEWACGIPGSLGGGLIMNAGAYGGELADVLESVTVLTADGSVTLSPSELSPAYRRMGGLPRGIVTSATLKLTEGNAREIAERMRALSERRRAAQPAGCSFGSTFRKVGDRSAGYYIERAGLKGLRVGGASVSEKHANFIVNDGGSGADVRALIDTVKLTVYRTSGIRLEEEVIYIGEF